MKSIELNGNVKDDGQFVLHNKRLFAEWCNLNKGKQVSVKFIRKGSKRTSPQNRYLFGVVYKTIQIRLHELGHIGLDVEDVHTIMKLKFNHETILAESGEYLEVPKTTSDLTKTEFSEYIDQIREWALDFLDIYIPGPNEKLELNL